MQKSSVNTAKKPIVPKTVILDMVTKIIDSSDGKITKAAIAKKAGLGKQGLNNLLTRERKGEKISASSIRRIAEPFEVELRGEKTFFGKPSVFIKGHEERVMRLEILTEILLERYLETQPDPQKAKSWVEYQQKVKAELLLKRR